MTRNWEKIKNMIGNGINTGIPYLIGKWKSLKKEYKRKYNKGVFTYTRIHTHNIKINEICNRLLINKIQIKNKSKNEGFNIFCKGLGKG